jgi:hypothetical protein
MYQKVPHTKPLQAWLQWMSDQGLHTYLNDHPFPQGKCTTHGSPPTNLTMLADTDSTPATSLYLIVIVLA